MRTITNVMLAICLSLPAVAQTSPTETLSRHWKISVDYTRAMAEKMPADGYSFKPTPAQMTFGEQILHIANSNADFAASILGVKAKTWDAKKADRATALAALDESAKLATEALSGLTVEKMHSKIKSSEGEMQTMDLILLMFDHTTHHRGQMVTYLRLKGIAPADYNF